MGQSVYEMHGKIAELEQKLGEAVEALRLARAAIDRDRSGMVTALNKIKAEVRGRSWIMDGRGPYDWDDERYKEEAGAALRAVLVIADDALLVSGRLADAEVKTVDRVLGKFPK